MLDLLTAGRRRPDAPAVWWDDGSPLTYRELGRMVDVAAGVLGTGRKSLVLCGGDRDLPTLVSYLAALRQGHTVAFLPATREVIDAYQPEYLVPEPGAATVPEGYVPAETGEPGITMLRRKGGPAGADIYEDTAVLLGTSGSTGSPKVARLSYDGVRGNADSVVSTLGITPEDRIATTLPIRYTYGLSNITTHLRAGAGIVLTSAPPASLKMWRTLLRSRATTYAAVPSTYEVLGDRHFALLEESAIHTMTQSGGRLRDAVALDLWQRMDRRQSRFFVMYGQTEATARITCLAPEQLPERLGSVGTPLPGVQLTIASAGSQPPASEAEGEIHYQGHVMLGYARSRPDLSKGADVDILATGDIGRLRDGFLYITGRAKRMAKILGHRVSLDELERLIDRPDSPVAVVSTHDEVIGLVGSGAPDVLEEQRRTLLDLLGVPNRHVRSVWLADIPRTENEKVDYATLTRTFAGAHPVTSPDDGSHGRWGK
ncbi:MAG: AMP-binding protein [Streptomyces sp.]|nr:AMP-binding protein [Streptomyces sp.]